MTAQAVERRGAAGPRERLIAVIAGRSLYRGRPFRLASGRESTFYFDMKLTAFDPEGADLISDLVLDALEGRAADYVGGIEMGAVPIVACVVQKSRARGRPIPGFFVRKEAKAHGTRRLIEGVPEAETLNGKRVVMIDDVTTTGGSVLKAVRAARAEGCLVDTVITVVDREEGAAENLRAEGVALIPLTTAADYAI